MTHYYSALVRVPTDIYHSNHTRFLVVHAHGMHGDSMRNGQNGQNGRNGRNARDNVVRPLPHALSRNERSLPAMTVTVLVPCSLPISGRPSTHARLGSIRYSHFLIPPLQVATLRRPQRVNDHDIIIIHVYERTSNFIRALRTSTGTREAYSQQSSR